jgi:hypothetical protein
MLAVSTLLAYGAHGVLNAINFFLDPSKPLSVKLMIVGGAIAVSLFFRWFNRTHPN